MGKELETKEQESIYKRLTKQKARKRDIDKIRLFLKSLENDLYEILDIKVDIDDFLEGVSEEDVIVSQVQRYEVFIVKTKYGYFWKSGKLISDMFEKKALAYKDAVRALL